MNTIKKLVILALCSALISAAVHMIVSHKPELMGLLRFITQRLQLETHSPNSYAKEFGIVFPESSEVEGYVLITKDRLGLARIVIGRAGFEQFVHENGFSELVVDDEAHLELTRLEFQSSQNLATKHSDLNPTFFSYLVSGSKLEFSYAGTNHTWLAGSTRTNRDRMFIYVRSTH